MDDLKVREIANDIQEVLADMKLSHNISVGNNRIYRVAPSIKRVVADRAGKFVALHFDLSRLPRNVSPSALRQQNVADEVSRRIGKPITVRGEPDVVYVVATEQIPVAHVSQ